MCGKRWKTAKTSFSCICKSRLLQETFKVDINEDDMEFMASRILLCFQGVIRRTIQAYTKGIPYCANATTNHFQWCRHKGECEVKIKYNKYYNWRASVASETLTGLTQLKIGDVCLDVRMSFCTLTFSYFCVSSLFDPVPITKRNPQV